jgi:hypothetical protein
VLVPSLDVESVRPSTEYDEPQISEKQDLHLKKLLEILIRCMWDERQQQLPLGMPQRSKAGDFEMMVARRVFMLLAMLAAMTVSAASASAQEIRYFVVQSTGLFEVKNTSTGGRFIIAPTSECIQVPGRGILQVRGYTDRSSRGEPVATQVRGTGIATVSVTYCPQGGSTRTIYSGTVGLPLVVPQTVSANANLDNITVRVVQNGRTVTRRLPVGTRP